MLDVVIKLPPVFVPILIPIDSNSILLLFAIFTNEDAKPPVPLLTIVFETCAYGLLSVTNEDLQVKILHVIDCDVLLVNLLFYSFNILIDPIVRPSQVIFLHIKSPFDLIVATILVF